MLERQIQLIRTDDSGTEEIAATRERLKANFPSGAVRRMTQLGMILSTLLKDLRPGGDDAIVYATQYAECRTLEAYLESFPTASPTGFQTSIHPGSVQQGMIRLAQPVGDFFPMAGDEFLAGQSLLTALLAPAPRVLLCGGEERGSWLAAIDGASPRTFAYGMILTRIDSLPTVTADASQVNTAVGRISLEPINTSATPMPHAAWFDILHARKNFSGVIPPGWHARLSWM